MWSNIELVDPVELDNLVEREIRFSPELADALRDVEREIQSRLKDEIPKPGCLK